MNLIQLNLRRKKDEREGQERERDGREKDENMIKMESEKGSTCVFVHLILRLLHR